MLYLIDMLIIKTDQPNTLVVTVSQNSELTNPEYLFSFTHIFSKERVTFIPTDISTHKVRYDEFYFVEGNGAGEINFPYQGLYTYAIYEQPSGSGNLNPSLATNVVENGDAQIFPSSASTMDSQYDIFISDNEDNSNIIFAPGEPNPPSATPSPTPTNTPTPSITPTETPTNTPTVTPTNTPTLTNTPTPSPTAGLPNPLTLGATWWSQYSNPSFLNLVTPAPPGYDGYIDDVYDGIDGSTFFQNVGPNLFKEVTYSACTPSFSGALVADGSVGGGYMTTQNGDYTNNTTDFTMFARVNIVPPVFFFTEFRISTSDIAYGGPVRWYQIKSPTSGGIEIDVWADPDTASGFLAINNGISYDTWINIAVRSYQDGPDYKVEFWSGGSMIQSASTVYTAVAPSGGPSQRVGPALDNQPPSGNNGIAEISWWNRKLTDTEMGDMFAFLNDRYC